MLSKTKRGEIITMINKTIKDEMGGTPMFRFQEKPSVFLETYGCQMNEYDSELIKSILNKQSYSFVPSYKEADIVLLNTCAIREHAERKVFGRVHSIRHERGGKPALYGILGCMATHLKRDLLDDRSLNINFIAGPDSYKRLPDIIERAFRKQEKTYDIKLSESETYSDIAPLRSEGINAWLAVMRGCDNFCTFCVVPYTRGRERSRTPQNVVEEVEKAVEGGACQITLLGQNVNSYRYENTDFADLLNMVSDVKGVKRVRYTSPNPKDFPDKLLTVMAGNKKICNQIHFPMQAGNNRILEAMNRAYTREQFLKKIEDMRKLMPDLTISTDIIVGFPTETDKEFEDTVRVMEEVQFDSAFIFKYSEREGTTAAKKFKDDVPPEVKTDRIVRLVEFQKETSYTKNKTHIGETHEVLIEAKGSNVSETDFQGRNDGNKVVTFPDGAYQIGETVSVKITEATPHVLRGIPIS